MDGTSPTQDIPVLVLNWNGWDDTFTCLRSLRADPGVREVWLVDNGSDVDRSAEAIAIYPGLRVHLLGENFGWAGGYNRALAKADAEGHTFAYLLNNDTEVVPGFLDAVAVAAADAPKMAAVGSLIAYQNPADFVIFDGTYHRPFGKALRHPPIVATTDRANGAGMLVRLEAVRAYGGFDERFFCYFEETDWCMRGRAAGWEVGVSWASVVKHKRVGSDVNANKRYYTIRNMFLVCVLPHMQASYENSHAHVDSAVREGVKARRSGNADDLAAVACGLYDGLRRKFGKRTGTDVDPAMALLAHLLALEDQKRGLVVTTQASSSGAVPGGPRRR